MLGTGAEDHTRVLVRDTVESSSKASLVAPELETRSGMITRTFASRAAAQNAVRSIGALAA